MSYHQTYELSDLLPEHQGTSQSATPGIKLTVDGKLAFDIYFLEPEAVRMILTANCEYSQDRARAMKLAAILSSEDEVVLRRQHKAEKDVEIYSDGKDSGTHLQETYDCERRAHNMGAHLVLLQQFELFERECKRPTSNTREQERGCKSRNLNFHAKEQIQKNVDHCHQVLKKRNIFKDVRPDAAALTVRTASGEDAQDPSLCQGRDEVLLRCMISGFFHHLVECVVKDRMWNVSILWCLAQLDLRW